MGTGRSRPLDKDPRCQTLAPVWSPFVDAFVDTLHAKGEAVHPPPPRPPSNYKKASSDNKSKTNTAAPGSDDATAAASAAADAAAAAAAARTQRDYELRSPGTPGPVFRPAAERLVAIGDLHGDLDKTKDAFVAGGLMDARTGRWVGGKTVAVQVGDQLDRGGDEVAILYMLERLRREAREAGGELIVMNGNHETMNVMGDFRYAFPPGVEDFRRWRGRQLMGAALKAKCGEQPGGCTLMGAAATAEWVERRSAKMAAEGTKGSAGGGKKVPPPGAAAGRMYTDEGPRSQMPRTAALAPGGPMATRFLAHQPLVVAVGSTVFAHGGILPHHVDYGLEHINKEVSDWIRGAAAGGGSGGGGAWERPTAAAPIHVKARKSMVWARDYSHPKHALCNCDILEESLSRMPGMRRVVVGHTIQHPGGVNAACDGKVLRIDVGMSAGCGGSRPEVLEILKDGEGGVSRLLLDQVTGAVVREPVEGVPVPAVTAAPSYYASLFGGGGGGDVKPKSTPIAAA